MGQDDVETRLEDAFGAPLPGGTPYALAAAVDAAINAGGPAFLVEIPDDPPGPAGAAAIGGGPPVQPAGVAMAATPPGPRPILGELLA